MVMDRDAAIEKKSACSVHFRRVVLVLVDLEFQSIPLHLPAKSSLVNATRKGCARAGA